MNNIDVRIDELLIELNQLVACKFFNELRWEDLQFTTNTHNVTKIVYQIVHIPIPKYGKKNPEERRIKISLGRKDTFDLRVNNSSYRNNVLNKIKEIGFDKYGCSNL